jgi:hypothetical protein
MEVHLVGVTSAMPGFLLGELPETLNEVEVG